MKTCKCGPSSLPSKGMDGFIYCRRCANIIAGDFVVCVDGSIMEHTRPQKEAA